MGREGMFDPGSLDLRAIKELKAADVVRQDEREDGSWVQHSPAGGEQGDPPGRPGRPMDEGQLQERWGGYQPVSRTPACYSNLACRLMTLGERRHPEPRYDRPEQKNQINPAQGVGRMRNGQVMRNR
jgi:hypothetical protein